MVQPTELHCASLGDVYGVPSRWGWRLYYGKLLTISDNVCGEWYTPCTLNTSFVDFEKGVDAL